MKIKHTYILLAMALVVFMGCSDDDGPLAIPHIRQAETQTPPTPSFTSGSADFSTYVSVGNSLTAGFSDNALFAKGQAVSFPKILSERLALAAGSGFAFTQPMMADDVGGLLLGGQQIAGPRLIFDAQAQVPVPFPGTPTTEVTNILSGPFNNMGVPGAKSYHLLAEGYGNVQGVAAGLANPYYARMATSATASVMGDVMAQSPTFFSLWIGANDVLGYATSGGTGEDHNMTGNLDAATYAGNDITHAGVFAQVYGGLLQTLTSGGAEGIVANLPNVADAPFFTTVPHAPLDPTNPDFAPQIPALNAQFGQLNQVFAALGVPERSIEFSTTAASAVVIKDESLTDLSAQITGALMAGGADAGTATILGLLYGQARQATADDLILLTASGAIATVDTDNVAYLMGLGLDQATAGQLSVTGLTLPMGDGMVLIPDEQTAISNAITAYNQTISNAATTFDLAFFDVNAFFTEVATNGYQAGSAFMTADLVTGGTFSLDGIHPSPRGNAVIANQMINAINAKYGSNLPTVNPVDYTGVYLD